MANAIFLEVLGCFLLATALLHRYCDMVNSNIVTVVGVFVSWFFSFMVIFLLPADLTSTAYRTCLIIANSTSNSNTNNNSSSIPTNITTLLPNSIIQQAIATNDVPISNPLISPISTIDSQYSTSFQAIINNVTNTTNINGQPECVIPWNLVSKNSLILVWRLIYWTSQFLTWLLLPIMQSYSKSGEFDNIKKIKYAIRSNLIYYSSLGAIFVVLLIYFILRNGIPTFSNLRLILISSSNTWGLFLLVVLLGYGLVELPRYLLDRSKHSQYLNRLYFHVATINAEKCQADERLDDVLEEVHQAYTVLGASEHNYLKQYLDQIVEKCPVELKKRLNTFRRQTAASNSNYQPDGSRYNTYDMQSMIRLHQKVINACHLHDQINCKWRHIIDKVIAWEDVARNQTDHESLETRKFKPTLPREKSLFAHIYTPRVEWYWKCLVRVWILRIAGTMMAIFSLLVVMSEIAFPISVFSVKISILGFFMDSLQDSQQYFYLELFSIISIGYLAICAFYTIFHIKIFNVYYLAPNKRTDEYSLLFSGMLLCRLTAPLCLNYLSLVYRDSLRIEETAFTTIMGHLDLIPFVKGGLYVFMPLCISAICLAIYFDVANQLLHKFGFERFIEDDEVTIDLIQIGRELAHREKGKLLRLYEPGGHSHTSSSGNNNNNSNHTTGDHKSGHNQHQQLPSLSSSSHMAAGSAIKPPNSLGISSATNTSNIGPETSSDPFTRMRTIPSLESPASNSSASSDSSLLPKDSKQSPSKKILPSSQLLHEDTKIEIEPIARIDPSSSDDTRRTGGGLFDDV